MRLEGGRERIVTFDLPLPLSIVGPLAEAIGAALEAEGWTDVLYQMDGACVLATPPKVDE